jgi:hypothetical protein
MEESLSFLSSHNEAGVAVKELENTAPVADVVMDAPMAEVVAVETAVAEVAELTATTEAVAAPAPAPEETRSSYKTKMAVVARALQTIEQSVASLRKMLEEDRELMGMQAQAGFESAGSPVMSDAPRFSTAMKFESAHPGSRVVEGVFDGQHMIGADGNPYAVPPNYASKSKLVEGDMMKLTITPTGTFIYKQVGPIERDRIVGVLGFDETTNEYYVAQAHNKWRVLKASVTYYKGRPGDEAIVLVPKDSPATWAAVDNIVPTEVVL